MTTPSSSALHQSELLEKCAAAGLWLALLVWVGGLALSLTYAEVGYRVLALISIAKVDAINQGHSYIETSTESVSLGRGIKND